MSNRTTRIVEAVNELTQHPGNPGYGKEATGVSASEHAYHVTLGQPCVIEGQYEVLPNLTDLMDEHANGE